MLSKVTSHRLLKSIREAHGTFHCPLIWDASQKKFLLDESPKFKGFSWIVLLLDVASTVLLLVLIVGIPRFGSNPYVTIMMYYQLGPAIMNIVLDVRFLICGKDMQQLINGFLQLKYQSELKTKKPKIVQCTLFYLGFRCRECYSICARPFTDGVYLR